MLQKSLTSSAPYLLDGAMEQNHEVGVELEEKEGAYILTYSLPQDWLAGEEREWPVILDPVVSAEPDISNIRDITVAQNFQYGADSGVLECGYRTGRGIERTYLKYAQLPEISPAQNIVEAVVRLCKPFDSSVTSAVEVHKVYNTWETSSITWNAQPSFNPLVEDYALVGDAGYYTWEVTDIVRGWYDGSNTGMMFKAPDTVEDGGKDEWKQFMSSDYSEYNDYEPALYISYRDNSGIEPYYTYETIDLGNAGTAYICDHTGQLKVVKEVSRYQSAVNPFSMSLVYNSDHFAKNGSGADDIQSSYGIDMCFGKGFSLDIVQRVETAELENAVGPYLIYRDGDGTDHYFAKQEDGTYKDEDGLGLTISVQGTTYTMKDDQGSTMTFRKGILTEMSDEAGNQIRIGYETATSAGEWFYSVYQKNRNGQDIRVADIRYSGTDSHVARITAATGQVQALTYDSGGRLTGISLDGAPVASYSYSGNRITGIRDLETGYGIDITYSGGRISSVTERSGSSSGGKYELLYSHEGTAYIDYGADRTKGTADDVTNTYIFDDGGRTVNTCSTDHAGRVIGMSSSVYSGSGATENTRKNNRVLRSGAIGRAAHDMLANSGFETGMTAWTVEGTGNGTGAYVTRSSYEGMQRSGNYSMEAYLTSTDTAPVGAYTTASLTKDKDYAFSAHINTEYISSLWGKGIYLMAEAPDGTAFESASVLYDTGMEWARPCVSFTAPATGTYRLHVLCKDASGWYYFDDLQLEEGEAPSGKNLLFNSDLQSGASGWQLQQGASYDSREGNRFLSLSGGPSKDCCAWQDVTVDLPGTETYVLSGKAWADSVPDNEDTVAEDKHAQDRTKRFGLQAVLYYSDSTTEYHYVPFCTDVDQWQYTSMTVVPEEPEKTVSRIRVLCAYEKNANVAWFDEISLVREAAQTMRYDDEGNLVSVTTTGLDEETGVYEDGNLIRSHAGGSGTFRYTYDDVYKHRMVSVTDGVVTQEMGHDARGNVTSTVLKGKQRGDLPDSGDVLKTSASYTGDGNRTASVTDVNGNTELVKLFCNTTRTKLS